VQIPGFMVLKVFTGMLIATSILGLGTGVPIRTRVKDPIGEGTWVGKSTFGATKCTKSTGMITGTTTASTKTTATATDMMMTTEMGMIMGATKQGWPITPSLFWAVACNALFEIALRGQQSSPEKRAGASPLSSRSSNLTFQLDLDDFEWLLAGTFR
jgi:hypothetical protein